jgi:hypothetical protein
MFYGYCHDSKRMRMMDYPDYVKNLQTGYSNVYSNPASAMQPLSAAMQPMVDAISTMMRYPASSPAQTVPQSGHYHHEHHHHHGCDCGCHHEEEHDCGCHEHDCSCSCCIRCADVIEYARCGETRRIPITFNNDTRRDRDVTLQMGNFATESGQDVGWQASLSTTKFKLGPCGETTVLLSVPVDCSKLGTSQEDRQPRVDSCKVVYATLRAEGCSVRPLVIAIAVLPDHCATHHACCSCSCCCN